ncbi:MAG: hypothetical protein ACI9ES_000589 [Oceanospirillaceae bacterium]|jgi:hypothetical protein
MNKAWWFGGLVAIIGVVFGVGAVVTGKQVNLEYQRYVAAITKSYAGVAKVTSSVDASLFSSANTLTLDFLDLSKPVADWAGTNSISFDINYSHRFFASRSVTTIAEGDLLDKIKSYQVNKVQSPLIVNSDYSYNMLANSVKIDSVLVSDAFLATQNDQQLSIGSSKAQLNLSKAALELDWAVMPSFLNVGSVRTDIGEIRLKDQRSVLDGDILSANFAEQSSGKFLIDSIKVSDADTQMLIEKFEVNVGHHIKEQRVLIDLEYRSDYVKVDTSAKAYRFDKPELQLVIDLDFNAMQGFVEKIQEMQQAAGPIIDPGQLLPLVSTITEEGVNFDIERVSVTVEDAALEGQASLKMAPFSIQEAMLDRQGLMQKIDLQAKLLAPKKFLQALPDYNPEQLQFIVGMGFLHDEGDSYSFDLNVTKGVVKVNGNQIPGL